MQAKFHQKQKKKSVNWQKSYSIFFLYYSSLKNYQISPFFGTENLKIIIHQNIA